MFDGVGLIVGLVASYLFCVWFVWLVFWGEDLFCWCGFVYLF